MSSLQPSQSRSARRLLAWSQFRLAAKAGVSETTVRAFENGDRIPSKHRLDAIALALKSAGVEFLTEDGGGPVVRLSEWEGPHESVHNIEKLADPVRDGEPSIRVAETQIVPNIGAAPSLPANHKA